MGKSYTVPAWLQIGTTTLKSNSGITKKKQLMMCKIYQPEIRLLDVCHRATHAQGNTRVTVHCDVVHNRKKPRML